MDANIRDSILQEFDTNELLFKTFTEKVHHLVSEILKEKNVSVHSLNSRVKTRSSLIKKLDKADAHYTSLSDITDISGIRIITYFSDEVDAVASLIAQEFRLDSVHSIDKRTQLDPDRFGYLSLHYVVSLAEHRSSLIEYKRYPSFKAEIQVRSILQHAWAEIEHDLGYKTSLGIPKEIRRKFSRLAGILELADEEFLGIRKNLEKYNKDVSNKIAHIPEQVIIDRDSLLSFIRSSEAISRTDLSIVSAIKDCKLEEPDNDYVEKHVIRLREFGIITIADLQNALGAYSQKISSFTAHWLIGYNRPTLKKSICLYLLVLILAAERFSEDEISTLFTRISNVTHGIEFGRDVKKAHVLATK